MEDLKNLYSDLTHQINQLSVGDPELRLHGQDDAAVFNLETEYNAFRITLDPAIHAVHITALVGQLPDYRPTGLLRALLGMNAQTAETVQLALSDDPGTHDTVELARSFAITALSDVAIADILRDFAASVAALREVLRNWSEDSAPVTTDMLMI